MNDLSLSAALCARLCHDLIGPAGAVVDGVELLSERSGAVDDEVLKLIRYSAVETTRRLKFFRMAMGVAAKNQTITAGRAVADDYFATGKITLDWSGAVMATAARRLPPSLVPIMLNLLLCGAQALSRGGHIVIDGTAEDSRFTLGIKASGKTVKVDDEVLLNLSGNRASAAVEARDIASYIAARLAAAAGGEIETEASAEAVNFSTTLPLPA